MPWFRRRRDYDRAAILDAAARARARKKRFQAIELYRRVLAVEPHNPALHARLAPLLSQTGQGFDAWQSFRAVARAHLREGHTDRALSIYRDATLHLPQEIQAWQAVARLQQRANRPHEALETLLEGSRNFRTRWLRPQAIALLRRARELDAWNFAVVLELARLLSVHDQGGEATLLFEGLEERARGRRLAGVRAAQFRHRPGIATAWRWLRASLRRPAPGEDDECNDVPVPSAPQRSNAVVQLRAAARS